MLYGEILQINLQNMPFYLRGASSMTNLSLTDPAPPSPTMNVRYSNFIRTEVRYMSMMQPFSNSAQNSPQTPPRTSGRLFVRQPDSFSNYKNSGCQEGSDTRSYVSNVQCLLIPKADTQIWTFSVSSN